MCHGWFRWLHLDIDYSSCIRGYTEHPRCIIASCSRSIGVASLNGCIALAAAIWRKIGPTVTKTAVTPSWLAWIGIVNAFDSADAGVKNHGFAWNSLLVFVFSVPLRIWNCLQTIYTYCVVWWWVRVIDPNTRFVSYVPTAIFWEQREALVEMTRMSFWDMAAVIVARNDLTKEIGKLKHTTREEAALEHQAMFKELAERTLSWRTSHIEMISHYHHCRRTLDGAMHCLLCTFLGIDPWTGTNG
jgi:hypothetical protein